MINELGRRSPCGPESVQPSVPVVPGASSARRSRFRVRNGAIPYPYPVGEITIAGNLKDLFRGLAAVGNDVDRNGNIRTDSVLIESMTLSGS
jgi:PmbA protein